MSLIDSIRWRSCWFVLASAALSSGCQQSDHQPLAVYSVKGELFVAGQPAESAVVAFHPINRSEWSSTSSRAVVEQSGQFCLTTYAAKDGAPEGNYVVTVYWPERPLDPAGEGDNLPSDKLGGRFATVARSNLRAQLGRQAVMLARIDLQDKAVLEKKEVNFIAEQPPR